MDRRRLLKGVAFFGGAWAIVARPWTWGQTEELEFQPLSELEPFRRLGTRSGPVTGTASTVALIGISGGSDGPDPAQLDDLRPRVADILLGSWAPGTPVPISYFTDIRCPLCPLFEARVHSLAADHATLASAREFPLFPGSDDAARITLAAALQSSEIARDLRSALRTAGWPLPEPRIWRVLEGVPGLDVHAVMQLRGSREVSEALATDRNLARLLGVPGTPSAVIGRTVVVGQVSSPMLRAIYEIEASEGPPGH